MLPESVSVGTRVELTARSNLHDIAEAVPGLREELVGRSRTAGLMVGWVAVVALPMWTLVDRVAFPEQAGTFLIVRLLTDIPLLLTLWALWRTPLGRRRPEALTFLVLIIVQLEIAWMITAADDPTYHLLGFTLAIYWSGMVLVARPRWTAALVGVSWAALGTSIIFHPGQLVAGDLGVVTAYLGTASVIAMLAHLRRYELTSRELLTRVRLEHEQQRTRVLLEEFERLSHEDALTALANRRRWDAELVSAWASARESGSTVGVVLLDTDHFKLINDRYGHPLGDEALRQVARLLTEGVRSRDLIARLGGDEFASLSLGVASATGPDLNPTKLMSDADEQLYRAKLTGNAVGALLPEKVNR